MSKIDITKYTAVTVNGRKSRSVVYGMDEHGNGLVFSVQDDLSDAADQVQEDIGQPFECGDWEDVPDCDVPDGAKNLLRSGDVWRLYFEVELDGEKS